MKISIFFVENGAVREINFFITGSLANIIQIDIITKIKNISTLSQGLIGFALHHRLLVVLI